MSYSSLYGDQPQAVTNYVNEASKRNLVIQCRQVEELEIPMELQEHFKVVMNVAFNALNAGCAAKDCLHDLWWICGGAAAFSVKYTTWFTDVDLFLHCEGCFNLEKMKEQDYGVGSVSFSMKGCVLDIFIEDIGSIQVIPVQLKIDMAWSTLKEVPFYEEYKDLFALFILSRFDIPASRVAIRFPYDNIGQHTSKYYVIDMTAFAIQYPTSLERLLKWLDRLTKKHFAIPCLTSIVPFTIFSEAEADRRIQTDSLF